MISLLTAMIDERTKPADLERTRRNMYEAIRELQRLIVAAGLDSASSSATDNVNSVTAGSTAVTVSPTTGDVVVDVDEANFTGIPQSGVTSLTTDLAAKVPTTLTITATSPLRIDGGGSADLSANRTLSLTRSDFYNAMFLGTGYGGALTFDGATTIQGIAPVANVYTMTREVFATDITVDVGVTLVMCGHRLFATGTLTNNGTIHYNGNAGTAGAAGATTSSTGIYSGTAAGGLGGAGTGTTAHIDVSGNANSSAQLRGAIATGGSNGDVPFRGGGGGGASATNVGYNGGTLAKHAASMGADEILSLLTGHPATTTTKWVVGTGGGSGGSNGGSQGGGGAGGGMVYVGCGTWAGSGAITANGGNGGNATGGSGGGGGGGGGLVVVAYGTKTGSGTTSATGGTGGTGASGGGNGGNGADGLVLLVNLSGDGT